MRKTSFLLLTLFAMCLFTVFAVAQTPGGTTGVNQNDSTKNSGNNPDSVSKSAQDSSKPVSGSKTDPYSVNSGPNGREANSVSGQSSSSTSSPSASSDSSSAASASGEKTLEGCIVKEQTDYFIQPRTGDRERLTGSADFSSHVGHDVTVHGNDQSASASTSPSASGTAGTSGSMANGSDRTSTSGSASTESQNNAAGSIAGNSGSSNATGTGSSASSSNGSSNNWSGKDFMVTKVDMVSASCPADIQSKIDQNKSK